MLNPSAYNHNHMTSASATGTATPHRPMAVVLAILCSAGLTACAGSEQPSRAPASNQALAYARCLRAEGVPNFPDPAPGAPLRIPSDIDTQAPSFTRAQTACARLMPGGSRSSETPGSQRLELLAIARCMRAHGVPDFADPTSSPPPPGNGNVLGGTGTYLAVGPPSNGQSPGFKAAANACRLP